METIRIDHKSLETKFLEHLNINGNNRILFTAPFGQGKSTFLNEVFAKQDEQYFTIKLYPVNYSVSSNEDVFELIKFDILVQLIGKYKDEINLQKEDFSTLLTSQVYIREQLKVVPFLQAILSAFGHIGKSAGDFLKATVDTLEDFQEFNKDVAINEENDVRGYLERVENLKGGPYEMDDISRLIYDFIQRLKSPEIQSGNKKTILIIDDLDRLDPDHIFRLFNVFSAHFDNLDASIQGNKFGFDKVIFVCDIENIRRIYRHKYGKDVDFKGYLDKFYSYIPFEFDNQSYLRKEIYRFLEKIKIKQSTTSGRYASVLKDRHNNDFSDMLRWFFLCLINAKFINLRTLVNTPVISIPDRFYEVNQIRLSTQDYPILWLFYIFKHFTGSLETLREKIDLLPTVFNQNTLHKASEFESDSTDIIKQQIISYCMPFLLKREQGIRRSFEKGDDTVAWCDELKCWLHFSFQKDNQGQNIQFRYLKATETRVPESDLVELDIYLVLSETFDKCRKMGVIN